MERDGIGRLAGLDTLRSVAIVCVVVFHLQGVLPARLEMVGRLGWLGVDLFFVLSGYLIGWQLLRGVVRGGMQIGEFYRRRAYRILPAYLVVVALYELVPAWRERPGLAATWKFVTFSYNLTMSYPAELAFSHAWSLCIEEHFYLLLPLVIAWMAKRSSLRGVLLLLVGVAAGGMLVRWWELTRAVRVAGDEDWVLMMKRIYYPTYSRLDGLAAGVALAAVRAFRPGWWLRLEGWGWVTLMAGMALLGSGCWAFRFRYPSVENGTGIVAGFPLVAWGFALLVASAVAKNGPLRVRIPGAGMLATLAFSLYLTHKAVAHVDRQVFGWMEGDQGWAATGVYAVSCIAVALVLYAGVERPFLRLREQGRRWSAEVEARVDPGL